jgi:hypothetical protein
MTGTATRSAALNAGDGRGATGAWKYHAPYGVNEPSARNSSPARAIRQTAWTNFRLIVAFGGGTINAANANGKSRIIYAH